MPGAWQGVHTAIVTPFRAGSGGAQVIDEAAYRALVARQVRGGVQGIVVAGTTGESPTLDAQERELLLRITLDADEESLVAGLREEGFIREKIEVDPAMVLSYLAPFVEPAAVDRFTFTREWMRGQFERVNDPRSEEFALALKLNLPTSYLLIHRTWIGAIGMLSQLNATAPFREILEESLPGFASD